MRAVIALVAAACAATTPVQGHEMWLQPSASIVRPGETVDIAMLVGDAADVIYLVLGNWCMSPRHGQQVPEWATDALRGSTPSA